MMTLPKRTLRYVVALAMITGLRGEEAPANHEVPPTPEKTDALLDASFDSLAKVLNESRQRVAEAEVQRNLAVEELDARRKAHAATERELADLKRQLAESRKSEANWKKQSEKLARKLAAGEEAHANLAKFRDQMKQTLEEFASLQGDIAGVRSELEAPAERMALRKEVEGLKHQNQALGNQLAKSRKQFASERKLHKKTREQLTAAKRRTSILENSLAESEQSVQTLTAKLDASEREARSAAVERTDAIRLAAANEKRAAVLQHEHSNMSKDLAAAKAVGKSAEDKAGRLGQQLKAANQQVAELNRTNGELHKKVDQAVSSLKAARDEHAKALSKLNQEAKNVQARADEQLRQSRETLTKLKNDTVELREISKLTSIKLKSTEEKVAVLENERSELRKTLEQREKEVAKLQANLEKAQGKETASNQTTRE